MKVPYMFIVGGREQEQKAVAVRRHGMGDMGSKPIAEAIGLVIADIQSKGLPQAES